MQDEIRSERESLMIIEQMINTAKSQFSEDGHLYLLWGWVVLICSISQFILFHYFHSPWHFTVWILTWVAIGYQVAYIRRKRKRRTVTTYTDTILRSVWVTFLVVIMLMAAVIGNIFQAKGMDFYSTVYPLFLLVYGIPTYISGSILKFRPLLVGGLACWALAVITAILPGDWQILMLAPGMIVAWIVPGYMLRARYKKGLSKEP